MAETLQPIGSENFVADESLRVNDIGKARAMAEAGDEKRTEAVGHRKIHNLRLQQAGSEEALAAKEFIHDRGAMAKASDAKAELYEHGGGLKFEAARLTENISHVGVETLYSFEQRRDEVRRDREAFTRAVAEAQDKAGEQATMSLLQKKESELSDRATILDLAFADLRVKGIEQNNGPVFMDQYLEYKQKMQDESKK